MKKQIAAEIAKMGIPVKNGKMKVDDIRSALKMCAASIGGEEDFTTEVEVDVLDMPEGVPENAELLTKKIWIDWRLYIEARTWGIKNLSVGVPDQEIELEFADEDDSDKTYTAKVKISDPEIEMDVKIHTGSGFRPRLITIGSDEITVTVQDIN